MSGGHLLLVECGQYVFLTSCIFLDILYVKHHIYIDVNTVHFTWQCCFHFPEFMSQGRRCTCFKWVVKGLFGSGLKVIYFVVLYFLLEKWLCWGAQFAGWALLPLCSSTPRGAAAHSVSSDSFLLCHLGWFFSPAPHLLASPDWFLWVGTCPLWLMFQLLPCATECMNRLHPNKQVFPGAVFFKAAQTRPPLSCGALCTSTFCFLHAWPAGKSSGSLSFECQLSQLLMRCKISLM